MTERYRPARNASASPTAPLRRSVSLLLVAWLAIPHAMAAKPTTAPTDVDPEVVAALARRMSSDLDCGDPFDAQVYLLSTLPKIARYVPVKEEQEVILRTVFCESKQQRLDRDLVLAVMQIESRFDRFAVSSAGAQGLMQVMPFWRNLIGRPQDNLTQIETNIRYGTAILAQYLVEARGDLTDALTRYNGSRGRLNYPNLVVDAYTKRWQTQTAADLPQLQAACEAYPLVACQSIKSAKRWYP